MKSGIDRLLAEKELRGPLHGRRVALLAHPASVTADLTHSLDALAECDDIRIASAFGPQHGLRGDKQDNMIESPDFTDPVHGIQVFSLYGDVRRPTSRMMDTFDVALIDLQDLGCRIYTFATTLLYLLEAAAEHGNAVWVLDRPNPAVRPAEGLLWPPGWERFVDAGPMPLVDYVSTIAVRANTDGTATMKWSGSFGVSGADEGDVVASIEGLYQTGLDSVGEKLAG